MTSNKVKSTAKNAGSIYILTNEGMPGLCKIGSSALGNVAKRINDLSNTSVPFPFKCVFSCNLEHYKGVEAEIHEAFDKYRVNPKREFFKIEHEKIIPLLKRFMIRETTNEINEKLNKDIDLVEQEAEELYIKKRPKFKFAEMGINIGETIIFTRDESKKAIVLDGNHVKFDGRKTALAPLTQKLLKREYGVAPLPYWKHKGKILSEYYNETYPKK